MIFVKIICFLRRWTCSLHIWPTRLLITLKRCKLSNLPLIFQRNYHQFSHMNAVGHHQWYWKYEYSDFCWAMNQAPLEFDSFWAINWDALDQVTSITRRCMRDRDCAVAGAATSPRAARTRRRTTSRATRRTTTTTASTCPSPARSPPWWQ